MSSNLSNHKENSTPKEAVGTSSSSIPGVIIGGDYDGPDITSGITESVGAKGGVNGITNATSPSEGDPSPGKTGKVSKDAISSTPGNSASSIPGTVINSDFEGPDFSSGISGGGTVSDS